MKALEECQYQFEWDLWNCSETPASLFSMSNRIKADRELAFLHAIGSAGVMYVVTKNCSQGIQEACSCDVSRNGLLGKGSDWKWGGCSDNIDFGEYISRHVFSTTDTGRDAHAAMTTHNKQVGIQTLQVTAVLICKCHGVSGSCTIRTCWRQLADFRVPGNILKKKYKKAQRVNFYNGELRRGNSVRNVPLSLVSKSSLVYLSDSPNYCKIRHVNGMIGTQGRQCIKQEKGISVPKEHKKNCERLCRDCGFQIRRETLQEMSKCSCKFRWCCTVTCRDCLKTVTKNFCHKED
ncbi:hypothetical protein ACJMK2_034365 [Sinanodonta woodiana]|uniref:Protein Wnt n=1 Tax=Sinanodonta woodiana TaxID=1069815 RepID=A0ABD3WRC0_SINWO